MKIGLVGTKYTIEAIQSMVDSGGMFVEFVECPCMLGDVVDLLDNIQKDLDAILFTGNHHYAYACRNTSASIPWTYVQRTANSVLQVLFRAMMSGTDIRKVSYDLADTPIGWMAELLCGEAGFNAGDIDIHRYNDTNNYLSYRASLAEQDPIGIGSEGEDYIDIYADAVSAYHIENISSGRANICLSGAPGVVARVKSYGYPAFLVRPTREDLIAALNELRLRHQIHAQQKSGEHQLAVISLSVQLTDAYNRAVQEYRQLYSYQQVESTIYAFAQSIGGAVEKHSYDHYLIYSTKVELDVATDHLSRFRFLPKILAVTNVRYVTFGIGFGSTHAIARNNAQYGDRVAKKQKCSCYYLMDGDGSPTGPFLIEQSQVEKEYAEILMEKISNETGVGIVVLNALAKANAQYGFSATTTGTLAKMCGMSVSNMNRIISRLEAKGYAQIVGSIPNSGAGRPKRLIRLKLGNDS